MRDSAAAHGTGSSYAALRTRAIESLLLEKGLVSSDAIERIVSLYENDIGPLNGARVVARAWVDEDFRTRLLADGGETMRQLGVGGLESTNVVVVENTPSVHNVIVCTLCSCYPWGVLGLPPSWYKSPAYRSRIVREPRRILAEFGLDLPPDVEIRVWDSSAETRYMVLPLRPAGTEGLDEEDLVPLVTREAMIGTGLPRTQ